MPTPIASPTPARPANTPAILIGWGCDSQSAYSFQLSILIGQPPWSSSTKPEDGVPSSTHSTAGASPFVSPKATASPPATISTIDTIRSFIFPDTASPHHQNI